MTRSRSRVLAPPTGVVTLVTRMPLTDPQRSDIIAAGSGYGDGIAELRR